MTLKLLTLKQLVEMLNITEATAYRWVHYKKIPYVKIGRRLGFIEEQINSFISSNNYKPDNCDNLEMSGNTNKKGERNE